MKLKILLILTSVLLTSHVAALSLAEFGITQTDTGVVDHETGLRWLDSDISNGGLGELQALLDDGWRIASEAEFFYLVSRQLFSFSGNADSELSTEAMNQLAESLSFELFSEIGEGISGPWLCRDYGDPEQYCQSATSFGGRFIFVSNPGELDTTLNDIYVYLSEVPMYGSLGCEIKFDCDYLGRSLMVRAVPLPPAGFLLLGGLLSLAGFRRS